MAKEENSVIKSLVHMMQKTEADHGEIEFTIKSTGEAFEPQRFRIKVVIDKE